MAFKSKGKDSKDQRISELEAEVAAAHAEIAAQSRALSAAQTGNALDPASDAETVQALLALEDRARKAAADYESSPNSDAVKAALMNAAHGIAHVRKALDQVRRLA